MALTSSSKTSLEAPVTIYQSNKALAVGFPSGADPHPLVRTRREPLDSPGSPSNSTTCAVQAHSGFLGYVPYPRLTFTPSEQRLDWLPLPCNSATVSLTGRYSRDYYGASAL